MKFINKSLSLFLLIISFNAIATYAQSDSLSNQNIKSASTTPAYFDEQAVPEGGMQGYYKFLATHIKYPQAAIDSNAQGTVIVKVFIDSSGNVVTAKIFEDPVGHGCGEEAVRVIKLLPRWKPGKVNGHPIPTVFPCRVKFVLH